ncbi:MAG: hypothetical protein H7X89_12730 [Rhizobiales bacterium]|nr:hypothetical protein [Hyphomicrobiales bacterium]
MKTKLTSTIDRELTNDGPDQPQMFESTKVVVGIMAGIAGCCFAAAALLASLPLFYADGEMKYSNAYLHSWNQVVPGRKGTVKRIDRRTEIEYSVVIIDSIGKQVAAVSSPRLPAPPDGEPIKYLPAMPDFYIPAARYSLAIHLGGAALLAACGLAGLATARNLRNGGRKAFASPTNAP